MITAATSTMAKFAVNAVAPVFGFVVALWIIWNVETRFYPVVTDFHVSSIVKTDGGYTAYGELRKTRSCEFLGLTIYAHRENAPKLLVAQYKKDIFGSDVGTGHQTWGPWTANLPAAVSRFDHLEIQGTHRCHALWLQTTEYANMAIKELPQ